MYSMIFYFFLFFVVEILYGIIHIIYNIILNFFFFFLSIIIDSNIAYTIVCYNIDFYFSHTFEVTPYAHV